MAYPPHGGSHQYPDTNKNPSTGFYHFKTGGGQAISGGSQSTALIDSATDDRPYVFAVLTSVAPIGFAQGANPSTIDAYCNGMVPLVILPDEVVYVDGDAILTELD